MTFSIALGILLLQNIQDRAYLYERMAKEKESWDIDRKAYIPNAS